MKLLARGPVLGLALAALAFLAAPALRAESLTDALIAAYRNSNLLDQNRAVLRAADEDVATAVAALRPVIAFSAETTYLNVENSRFRGVTDITEQLSTDFLLSARMTLFDFGRNNLAIEAAKESVLATREALVAVEQRVLLSAIVAYVNVRLAGEIVSLNENSVRVLGEQLRAAQDRFDVGEITRTDVALAESRLEAARAGLAVAEGDQLTAREAYRAATGAYPGNLAPLPAAPRLVNSLDEARAIAGRTHPSVRQAQRQVSVAEINTARARAAMRPSLSGSVALGIDDDSLRQDSVRLSLNQTLYAGGSLSAAFRQAIASRDSSRANLLQTTLLIEQEVGNAWADLSSAGASISAREAQVVAAQTAFDGVQEEATLGARTTLDVLDAEQELLDAQNDRISAEATRYVSVYQVLSAMGLLTAEHLKLGIPTYDPAAYYNAVSNAPAHTSRGKALDRIMKTIGN